MAASKPAPAGPPFVTDDPEPVEKGTWEVNYGFAETLVQGETSATLPTVDANYGLLRNLQLHVQPQLVDMKTAAASQFGIGDTEVGAKYRFVDEDDRSWIPMVAFYPRFEVPTGDSKRGLGSGVGRTFLPIWAQKTIDKWTVYGGAGYWIDPGAAGKNAWFVGCVALYRVTNALQLGGEMFLQTANSPGGKDAPGFNLGGSYDLTEDYHILLSAGRGLANQFTTNRFSAYLGFQVIY